MMNRLYRIAALGIVLAATPSMASAQTPTWAVWNTVGTGYANGTLFGSPVSYRGNSFGGQTSNSGIDYFNWRDGVNRSAPYTQGGLTAPNNRGLIQLDQPGNGVFTFSEPVTNLYLALISVGQPGHGVTYTFDQAFTVVSNNNTGCGYWGCGSYTTSGNTLTGNEFSGTLMFSGSVSSLTITTSPNEYWHGFTVGAEMATVTPEPVTMLLLGTGLLGLGVVARRRRKERNAEG